MELRQHLSYFVEYSVFYFSRLGYYLEYFFPLDHCFEIDLNFHLKMILVWRPIFFFNFVIKIKHRYWFPIFFKSAVKPYFLKIRDIMPNCMPSVKFWSKNILLYNSARIIVSSITKVW